MATRNYSFDYHMGQASASFEIDTSIFTEEIAKITLEFFSWDYDKQGDVIDEALKKYAMKAIQVATFNSPVTEFVIRNFQDLEGYANIDGTLGIKLIDVEAYEFDTYYLDMEVTHG